MAKTEVKFYSVSLSKAPISTARAGGIYFVEGGELYKETQRFGLARVTNISSLNNGETVTFENLQAKINELAPNAARGDLAYGYGAAKVYNGSTWVDLGADSSATDELAARVSTLETDVSDIKTVVSVVTAIPEGEPVTTTTVSADSGSFTNLTVGGKTIQQIIDSIPKSYAAGSSNGIEVSVTTSGGIVTNVTVNASAFANVMHFKGAVAELPLYSSGVALGDIYVINIDDGGYIDAEGKPVSSSDDVTKTPLKRGQEYICVDPTYSNVGKWELIGDQNTGATKGYVDAAIASAMTYSSATGIAASASTLSAAVQALATAVDGAKTALSSDDTGNNSLVTAGAVVDYIDGLDLGDAASYAVTSSIRSDGDDNALATEGAVARYVASEISTNMWSGSATAYPIGSAAGENRPSITVEIDESAAEGKVVVTATKFGTAVGANVVTLAQGETFDSKSNSSDLPTASQVFEFVTSQIGSVSASTIPFKYNNSADPEDPSAATNITKDADTIQDAIKALDDAATAMVSEKAAVGQVQSSASHGVTFSISLAASSAEHSASINVDAVTDLGSTYDENDDADKLVTAGAVKDAIEAQMVWYDDDDVTPQPEPSPDPDPDPEPSEP